MTSLHRSQDLENQEVASMIYQQVADPSVCWFSLAGISQRQPFLTFLAIVVFLVLCPTGWPLSFLLWLPFMTFFFTFGCLEYP